MMIVAALKPAEITKILLNHGFTGLTLKAVEERKYTYSFVTVDVPLLKSKLNSPSVAAAGKVLVFEVPGVGRLGVSPAAHMLRIVDETTGERVRTNKGHLSKAVADFPEALEKAFIIAAASPTKRLTFLQRCWEWANKHHFGGAMDVPSLSCTATSPYPKLKTARGVYLGGRGFGPGKLWIWGRLFNAELPFFLEVFLHELCHQAAWTISKSTDHSEGGHGPVWKGWMRKIGLDPSRYDSTDAAEYEDTREAQLKELELTKKYGPRTNPDDLRLANYPARPEPGYEYVLQYEGRLFRGKFTGKQFSGNVYPGKGAPITLKYKALPALWLPK